MFNEHYMNGIGIVDTATYADADGNADEGVDVDLYIAKSYSY